MINFRLRPDMFVAFPKNQLAPFTDNSMPRRDWSKFDAPLFDVELNERKKPRVNVARMKIDLARQQGLPGILQRMAE